MLSGVIVFSLLLLP